MPQKNYQDVDYLGLCDSTPILDPSQVKTCKDRWWKVAMWSVQEWQECEEIQANQEQMSNESEWLCHAVSVYIDDMSIIN